MATLQELEQSAAANRDNQPEQQQVSDGMDQFPMLSRALSMRSNPQSTALRQQQLQDTELFRSEEMAQKAQEIELSKVHAMTALMAQRMRIQDSMEKNRQTMLMIKDLIPLAPGDPDFDKKFAELGSQYPMALQNEVIQKKFALHTETQMMQQKSQAALDLFNKEEAARLQQQKDEIPIKADTAGAEEAARKKAEMDATGGIPEGVAGQHAKLMGDIATNQETFKNTTKDADKATLIAQYKGLVAQKDALTQQYPKLEPSATAPVTPHPQDDDALTWAKANPDDPRAKKIMDLNTTPAQ